MSKKHIFVLDDDPNHLASIKKLLEEKIPECTVTPASTTEKGYTLLSAHDYDLFILDVLLSDGSGLDFAFTVRGIPKFSMTWIVFISGHDAYALEAMRSAHCYDYIVKPYDPGELVGMVRKLLQASLTKKKSADSYLRISQKGICFKINTGDILYIEVNNRLTDIHTVSETYTLKHWPLEKIKKQIDGGNLLQCHRSFIVNSEKLHAVITKDRQTHLMLEGCPDKIPVGIKYKTSFLELSQE
jgi:DNA-binding LytR/AlgR family response regulator